MNKKILRTLIVLLLCWTALEANAQWSLGLRGGWTYNNVTRSNSGRIDETFSSQSGFEAGIQASYSFTQWFALRADLSYMQRSHRMDRNLNYLEPVYTKYRNSYLMLPLMADFSFGGEKLRGHALLGGYAGYWLQSHVKGKTYWMTDYYVYFNDFDENREFNNEDRRFTAGLVGGIGLSYDIADHWSLNLDALYYYDLVSFRKGYEHLSDPRYLNTIAVDLGVSYKF